MRKLLLFLILVSTQANSEMISIDGADWKFIGNNSSGDTFYDVNSIKRNENGVINYISYTNSFIGASNSSNAIKLKGDWVMSIIYKASFDCNVSNSTNVTNANLFKQRNLVEPFDNQIQGESKEYWENKLATHLSTKSPLENLREDLCETVTFNDPASKTIPKVSINDAKAQCSDIGFKAGTEKFGDCVLELIQ